MLLKSKQITALAVTSLFMYLADSAEARVSECGVVHYLENKSNGVEVMSNDCRTNGGVTVGSRFNLMPGARLWIKSPMNSKSEKYYHAICQNRSPVAINISVDNAAMPWLRPKGLKNCSGWIDNKLHCDGVHGEKNALYCVIAAIDPSLYIAANAIERTTSVTVRDILSLKPSDQTAAGKTSGGFEIDQIITAMRPETELCRSVYQPYFPVKVEWTVDTEGRVVNLVPRSEADGTDEAEDTDKKYIDCVVDVVKYFPYPKPSKFYFLSASF
ncbi:MAG: hypothetical protein ACU837_10610 [Gammaproteobacteria bacterium]